MTMTLGTLHIVPVLQHLDLVATPVSAALQVLPHADAVGVAEIDASLSDTAAFCDHYQVGLDHAANCVVLEAKRGDTSRFVACVILATTRADINGLVRRTLDARKVSFAPMDQAVAQTGMEYGAITPVGLPPEWTILIDKAVIDTAHVIIGGGVRGSKLAVPGNFLATLPNAQVLDGLGQVKS